jgi:hypothetical protein
LHIVRHIVFSDLGAVRSPEARRLTPSSRSRSAS